MSTSGRTIFFVSPGSVIAARLDDLGWTRDKPAVRAGLLSTCVMVTALSLPARVLAQGAPGPEAPSTEDDDEDREGTPRPFAADGRTGHFTIAALAAAEFPAGDVAPGRAITEVLDVGVSFGGMLAVGVSRYVSIDASGRYGLLYPNGECDSCTGDLASASLGIRYHLAQGSAFDPWGRLGVGYRTFSVEHTDDETDRVLNVVNGRYHGVDIAQLALGGWFYPARGFGLGPFLEVDMGTMVAWAEGSSTGTRPYAFFQIGLAIAIDPVEWASPTPSTTPPAKPEPAKATKAATADTDAACF